MKNNEKHKDIYTSFIKLKGPKLNFKQNLWDKKKQMGVNENFTNLAPPNISVIR